MPSTVQSPYTPEQIKVWLQGLLTIAWADGHFDEEEKDLITAMTETELAPNISFLDALEPLPPEQLAASLGHDRAHATPRHALGHPFRHGQANPARIQYPVGVHPRRHK